MLLKKSCVRLYHASSFLRYPSCICLCCCVVVMLHERVNDYITYRDLVHVPAEFFKDSKRTWLP